MERRIDRIYQYVCDHANVTTNDVSEALQIQRTNASKDLNLLIKNGTLRKTDGRPVRYFAQAQKSGLAQVTNEAFSTVQKERPEKRILTQKQGDVFTRIIGSSGSMRNAVEQAKAAILYPPRGLNCLITGPTGSGKTFLPMRCSNLHSRNR